MSIGNILIDTKLVELIKKTIDISVEFQLDEVVSDVKSKLKKDDIQIGKDLLLNDEYKYLEKTTRERLLIYFYWLFNQNAKQNTESFISMPLLRKHLNFKQGQEQKILNNFSFFYPFICTNCGKITKLRFRNLKNIEFVKTNCKYCNHIIDRKVHSECKCNTCKELISDIEYYFNSLPNRVENYIRQEWSKYKHENSIRNYSNERLKWYADNYSSDLSKTERKIISFRPNDINELKEILNKKEYNIVISKLKDKKVIFEKKELKSFEQIYKEILNLFDLYCLGRRNQKKIDFYNINLSELKVSCVNIVDSRLSVCFDSNSIKFKSPQNSQINSDFIAILRFIPDISDLQFINFLNCKMELNPYYFEQTDIDIYPAYNKSDVKNLFNSNVERNLYESLYHQYRNCIIMVNVRLSDLIELKSIESFYEKDELKYLNNCIVDFVLYSKGGSPLKIIELQRGKHHDENDYIYKDKLKKTAIMRIGIKYKEVY